MILEILKMAGKLLLIVGFVFLIYFTTNPNMKRKKKK